LHARNHRKLLPKEIDVNRDSEDDLIDCYLKYRQGLRPMEDPNDHGATAA